MTKEELIEQVGRASSVVKLVCGIGNNAAWLVCLDALDRLKKHRNWKQHVKGGSTVAHDYNRAIYAFKLYEKKLLYTNDNRFFHVADMAESVRRSYSENLTDEDYYQFWASIGARAYETTRPLITSLCNKYRLSLESHGIKQTDILAWSMTAMACLDTSRTLYNIAIDECVATYRLPEKLLRHVFRVFELDGVAKLWNAAMVETDQGAHDYKLNPTEERNIGYGLEQLASAWLNVQTIYGSTADCIADYVEVFRTKGFQKKALREISELREETEAQLTQH